jgi:hypothetical protein
VFITGALLYANVFRVGLNPRQMTSVAMALASGQSPKMRAARFPISIKLRQNRDYGTIKLAIIWVRGPSGVKA